MSEQILERTASVGLPGGAAGAGPSADPPKPKRKRTFLVVALAIIAGLVIGGAALFLLQPGSSPEDLATGPSQATGGAAGAPADASGGAAGTATADATADGAAADATADGAAAATPARATTRLTSRDPFAPLIPKRPPAPAPKPAAVPAAAASATGTGSAGAAVSTPTPASGGTISALSISPLGNAVTLKLDGKKYEVDEGETFAKSYRLYDIFNADCAGFLYGDQNAVVCQGDSVTIG
jgi:hypothetical protein